MFTGEPLPVGSVDVAARAAVRSGGDPHVPQAGHVGVLVPKVDASAGFLAGVADWLSIGGELRVANASAASKSAFDTASLPFAARSVFGLGPEVAIGARFGEGNKLFIGGSLSASLTRVGWGSYELERGRYRERSEGTDVFVMTRLAAFAGGRATRWLSIYTGAVISPQVVNVGFSDGPIVGSTLRTEGSVFMPLLGARVDLGRAPGVFIRAAATAPLGTRFVAYSPIGMDLGFGFRVE